MTGNWCKNPTVRHIEYAQKIFDLVRAASNPTKIGGFLALYDLTEHDKGCVRTVLKKWADSGRDGFWAVGGRNQPTYGFGPKPIIEAVVRQSRVCDMREVERLVEEAVALIRRKHDAGFKTTSVELGKICGTHWELVSKALKDDPRIIESRESGRQRLWSYDNSANLFKKEK